MNREALKVAKRVLPLYGQHLDLWTAEASKMASCKRGCNNCCYMLVGSTLSEGASIAAYLMETPAWISEIRKLKERLQEDVNEIRSIVQQKSHKWLASKKPCAFLDTKSGDCRIYKVRPTACRTYFVTSDPEQCSPDRPGAQVLIIDPEPVLAPFIQEMLSDTMSVIPPLTGSLQSMILAGLELIMHSPPKFQKWIQENRTDDM